MKKITLPLIILALFCYTPLFAASIDDTDLTPSYGSWNFDGERVFQKDQEAGMAKASMPYQQDGIVSYEFKVCYQDGIQDGMGGFGIHLFVDKPAKHKAWGEGDSYLLWVNYDENPTGKTPKGLSAQIYKSSSNSRMTLIESFPLNSVLPYVIKNMYEPLPIKLVVNTKTGEAKVYDPTVENYVYKFSLDQDLPLKGDYVTIRTNSLNASFSY